METVSALSTEREDSSDLRLANKLGGVLRTNAASNSIRHRLRRLLRTILTP